MHPAVCGHVRHHGGAEARLVRGRTLARVPQYLVNLLLAQEVLPVRHISDGAKLSQVHLLRHAADHVLLLRHFDVEALLLHLHGGVLDLLLVGLEERLEYLGLDLAEAVAARSALPVVVALLDLLELLLNVVFQLVSSSDQVLLLLSHRVYSRGQDQLVFCYLPQLALEHEDQMFRLWAHMVYGS